MLYDRFPSCIRDFIGINVVTSMRLLAVTPTVWGHITLQGGGGAALYIVGQTPGPTIRKFPCLLEITLEAIGDIAIFLLTKLQCAFPNYL